MAIKSLIYKDKEFDISYNIYNQNSTKDIVFLHGWGSSKELMAQAFSSRLGDFRQIYIDLPGFGSSNTTLSLFTHDYAQIIKLFLSLLKIDEATIVGHSFGGKVAMLLAPKRVVLLSTAGILWKKSLKVRSKIALFKAMNRLGLSGLRSIFVADDAKNLDSTMYETFKNVVDEDFREIFRTFRGQALLCWGRDDEATPLKSATLIESLIDNSKLEIFDAGHYFFLEYSDEVANKIEEFCHE